MLVGIVSRGYSIVPPQARAMSLPARTWLEATADTNFRLKIGKDSSVLFYTMCSI